MIKDIFDQKNVPFYFSGHIYLNTILITTLTRLNQYDGPAFRPEAERTPRPTWSMVS